MTIIVAGGAAVAGEALACRRLGQSGRREPLQPGNGPHGGTAGTRGLAQLPAVPHDHEHVSGGRGAARGRRPIGGFSLVG